MSAFAHGKEWSLLGTTMEPPVAAGTPGVKRGRMTGGGTVLIGATNRVALCVERGVIDVEAYLR
jgi:hypothetical protein